MGTAGLPIGGGDLCFGKSTVWRMGLRNGRDIHRKVVRFSSRDGVGGQKRDWQTEEALGGRVQSTW